MTQGEFPLDDPFVTYLYDGPGVTLRVHEELGEPVYVLDFASDDPSPVRVECFGQPVDGLDDGHAVIPVD